jgi:hypothetical protein
MLAQKPSPAQIMSVFLLVGLGFGACSTGESALSSLSPASSAGGSPGGGGSTSIVATASGGMTSITIDASGAGTSGTITETVECTEGADCTCPTLTVAVIGQPGKWGANPAGDSDTAFQEWLNSSSAGTAKADVYPTKPTLTAEFLAKYNVIILAALAQDSNTGPFWSFQGSEVAAFQDWIESKGGGVIALTGYSGDGAEINPANQLLGFSGVTYNNVGVFAPCSDWRICNCAESNTLSAWVKTDPVILNLSNSITAIGFQNGRSINAPNDAHVAATVPGNDGPANVLVGKIAGTGRILAYGDEWITYTSQWTGEGVDAANCTTGYYPQDAYQTAQFWFNMIKWVQPRATCFKIVNQARPVTIW